MKIKNFTTMDNAIYYLMVIFSLGGAYFSKVITKKAIAEMLAEEIK